VTRVRNHKDPRGLLPSLCACPQENKGGLSCHLAKAQSLNVGMKAHGTGHGDPLEAGPLGPMQ